MKSKLKIGIDINEILRARWVQFDKYYVEEFDENGVPEGNPYHYDLFENYKWEDTVEIEKELKEPDDMPDNINPLHYQIDEKTGEADADSMIFKKEVEVKLTAKELYNRFMYQDYLFEIHGSAPVMYRGMDVHINKFLMKYEDFADFILVSAENKLSRSPTLFFLSKIISRFEQINFVDKPEDMWKHIDILITTDPKILAGNTPRGKQVIKIARPYNVKNKKTALGVRSKDVLQLNDLNGNRKFEKIIHYSKRKKK